MATYATPVAYRNASGGVDISGISVGGSTGGTIDGYTIYWGTTATFTPSATYKYSFNTASNPLGALLAVPAASFIPALPGAALYFKYTHNVGGVPKTTYSAGSNVIANTNVTTVTAVANTSTGALDVSWVATALAGATYNVGRNTVNTGTPTVDISGVSGTTVTITPPNGRYYVAVQATFGGTAGAWIYSTAQYYAATVPGTVTNFVASNSLVSTATVTTISWTAPSSGYTAGGTLTYTVDISSGTTGGWTTLTTTAASATYTLTAVQQTALIAGTPYYVRITPKQSLTLLTSTTVTASPIFGMVTDISASNDLATGNITVSWSALAGATSYEVVYSTVSTISSSIVAVTGIAGTSTVISGLTLGTLYYFAVKANIGGFGYGGFPAAKIVNIRPTTYPGAIVAAVTANTTTTISFSWPTPSVGYSGALTYRISLNGAALVTITTTVSGGNTIYTRPSLVAGTAYSVYFTATNTATLVSTSNTMSTGTLTTTPTSVIASKASNTSIAISFTPPTTNGLSITSYTVTPYIAGVIRPPLIDLGPSSPITISSLDPQTSYTYTIAAVTSIGQGTTSAQTAEVLLPFVSVAGVPSDVSYNCPTATRTYANSAIVYSGLAYSDTPVVVQVSPCVWTVAYNGFTDTLTNVKTVIFTDINGLFVDLSYGVYGSLVSQAHTAARNVGSGGDIIYVGAGTFVDNEEDPSIAKSVTIQGGVGPGPSILQNSYQGPLYSLNITGNNITIKNLTLDNSNSINYTGTNAGYLLLGAFNYSHLPPGQAGDASRNLYRLSNFVCDSCIFTNALTSGLDPTGSSYYNRRGVSLQLFDNVTISNCTFPKTYEYGLSLNSVTNCTVTNCTFYASQLGTIQIRPINVKAVSYTTTNLDLSDPSNIFIDISTGTYVNPAFGGPIVPTTNIVLQPYSPTYFAPYTFGTTGTPDVKLPASMDYVYIADPTVVPSESVINRATRKRYTSDQVYLEAVINTYSWYGYQFSSGKHLIENRFNPIPLLNNLPTATPEGSTVMDPHLIEFQQQSDVILLTDVSMSAVSYNQVVVISDDVSGTYIYNSNVDTLINNPEYLNDLYIIPNTVPNDLSSNAYPGVRPTSLISVMPASGGAYTYSSDDYKYRIPAGQLPYLPAVRGTTWYTSSTTDRIQLLTGPENAPFAPTVILSSGNHFLTVAWSDNPGGAPTTLFLTDVSSTTNLEYYTHTDPQSGNNTFTIIQNGATFIVSVTASNEFGSETSAPQSILVATVPDAPTEGATDVSSTFLRVYWTPNDDGGSPILSYKVYWYDASTNLLDGSANGISSSPYTITGLTTGKSYDWAVSATNAFGEGAQSPRGPSYTPSVPPGPPTDVTGTRLDTGVSLAWNPPINAGGSAILYYNIYDASTGLFDVSSNGNNNTVHVTGLTNGQSYSFYVKAVNIAGEGAASAPSAQVIPAGLPIDPVTGLSVASVGDGTITLTFDAVGAIVNGAAFVKYNIFQSTDGISFLVEYESPTNTFTATGLTNGLSYWFKASIENDVGEGDQSASVGPTLLPIPVTLFLIDLTTTYNGGPQTPTVYSVPSGVTNADVVFSPTAETDAGIYEVTATLTNPVYQGAPVSGTFLISPASLTVTANNHTRNYWITDSISNTAFTTSALIGSDSVDTVTISSSANDTLSTPVGTHTDVIIPSAAVGTGLHNYAILYDAGNLTILPTLPDSPIPITATHTTTIINLSWDAPVNTGNGELLYYTLYYCTQSDLSSGQYFFDVATDISFNVSDLGGINNGSITSDVQPDLYVFSLFVTNAVGTSAYYSLFNETSSDYTQNIINATTQLTSASSDLDGVLTSDALPIIDNIVAGAGMTDYGGLETFRDLSDTSIEVYVYAEAQAIAQIGSGNLGVPQDTVGSDANAVLEHMYASAAQYPGSVTPELLNDLSGLVASGTPFWLTYAEFVIGVDGQQIFPYPVIPVTNTILSIIPVPHFIEIKFYLNVISSSNSDISGQVLVTRDGNNMITAVEPGSGTASVSLNVPVPAPAGSVMHVTLNSGTEIYVAVPGLADTTASSSPDAPTGVTAVQNGSSIVVSWDNPNNPFITSYTISETLGSGFSATIPAPATQLVINTLSVLGPYQFSVIATNSGAETSPDSPPAYADYSPRAVPCFPAGTRILTPSGYRVVESLVDTDLVQTADGRAVPVKLYMDRIANPTTKDAPYLVPAHSYGRGLPPADLRLSPLHAFQTKKGIWHVPRHAFNDKVKQYGVGVPVDYYHVECPNYFTDNLVVDGCIVESYAGKQVRDITKIFTFVPRYQALIRSNGEGNRATMSK